MKTLLLILVFVLPIFAQQPPPPPSVYRGPVSTNGKSLNNQYTNSRYGFSLNMPADSKSDKTLNAEMKFLTTYVCTEADCSVPGIFSVSSVEKTGAASQLEMVRLLQNKQFQNRIADTLITSFGTQLNATILSKQYLAYKGRPALKISFNLLKDDLSLTGEAVELYVEEMKALVTFGYFTGDSYSDRWNAIAGEAIRSFSLNAQKKLPPIPPRRPNVLTVQGETNLNAVDAHDSLGPVPKTISGGVLNGKAANLPQPEYPPAAKAVRAGGTVTVQVKIDEAGNVVSARAVSGHPLLKAAAEEAAKKATFSPTQLQGVPVSVTGIITYNFIL